MVDIDLLINTALEATGIPCAQIPLDGVAAPTVLCWHDIVSTVTAWSNNRPTRIEHVIAVDIYSRTMPTHMDIKRIADVLEAHGLVMRSYGPFDYEYDTRWHHVPLECRINHEY